MKLLAILLLSVPAWAVCGGTTYEIGSGQTYANWTTAFAALQSDCGTGVTWTANNILHFHAGIYTQPMTTASGYFFSTGPTAREIIASDSGAIFDGLGSATYMLVDTGQNYVTVDGGEWKNTTIRAMDFSTTFSTGIDHVVSGVKVHDSGQGCVRNTGSGIVIHDSEFYNCTQDAVGVLFTGSGACLAYNLNVHDNSAGTGIYITQPNCTVRNSRFTNNPAHGGITFDTSSAAGGIAYANYASGNLAGILNDTATGGLYYNNILVTNLEANIAIAAGGQADCYNNTLVNAGVPSTFVGREISIDTPGGAGPSHFANNLIVAGSWDAYAIRVASVAGFTSDYNDIFLSDTGGGLAANFGRWNSTTVVSFASWKSTSSQDANSISSNPLLINPAGTTAVDFKWSSGSPCRNAGTTIGAVTTDYFGTVRPQGTAYDIGAYEFPGGGTWYICSGCAAPNNGVQAAFDSGEWAPGDTFLLKAGDSLGSLTLPLGTHDLTWKTTQIDTYPRGYRIKRNSPELAKIDWIQIGSYPIQATPNSGPLMNARTLDGLPHGLTVGDSVTVLGGLYDAYNCAFLNQPPYDPAHGSTSCDAAHSPKTNIRAATFMSNGTVIRFRGVPLPTPLTQNTNYYLVNYVTGTGADSFNVAATLGGSPIVIPQFDPTGQPFNIEENPLPFINYDTAWVVATPSPTTVEISNTQGGSPVAITQFASAAAPGGGGLTLVRNAPFYNLTFDGIEITSAGPSHLVEMIGGASNFGEPHSIHFNRCYFHGSVNQGDTPRMAIQLYARASEVRNSICENVVSNNNDTQCFHLESTGHVQFDNNELYNGAEGIMSGGDYPWFGGLRNPQFHQVTRNWVHKNAGMFQGLGMTYLGPTQFQFSSRWTLGDCVTANADMNIAFHCFTYEEDTTNPQSPTVSRTEWNNSLASSTFTITTPLTVVANSCPIGVAYGLPTNLGCGYVYIISGAIHMDHNFSGAVTCPAGVTCTHLGSPPVFPSGSTRIGIALPNSTSGFDPGNFYVGQRPLFSKNEVESKFGDYWNIQGNEFRRQSNCDGGHACQNVGVQMTVAINGSGPSEPVNYLVSSSYSTITNNIFESTAGGVGAIGKSFGYSDIFEFGGFGQGIFNSVTNNLGWDIGSGEVSVTAFDGQFMPSMGNVANWNVSHNSIFDITNGFTVQATNPNMTFSSNVLTPKRAACSGPDGCTRPSPISDVGVVYPNGTGLVYYPPFGGIGWVQTVGSGGVSGNFLNNLMMNRMGNFVNSGVPTHYPTNTYLIQFTDVMNGGACTIWGDPGCPDTSLLVNTWVERNPSLPPTGNNYRASDLRITPTQIANYPAADSRAIGADIDEIEALTGHNGIDVEYGNPTFAERSGRRISPGSTTAVLSYVGNGSACSIRVWPNANYSGSPTVNITDSSSPVLGGVVYTSLTGLTGGTYYQGKRICGTGYDIISFTTNPTTPVLTLQFAPPGGVSSCRLDYGSTSALGSSTSPVSVSSGVCTISAPASAFLQTVYLNGGGGVVSKSAIRERGL